MVVLPTVQLSRSKGCITMNNICLLKHTRTLCKLTVYLPMPFLKREEHEELILTSGISGLHDSIFEALTDSKLPCHFTQNQSFSVYT